MFKPSARFMLSPRFFALPAAALAVIAALAQQAGKEGTAADEAGAGLRARTLGCSGRAGPRGGACSLAEDASGSLRFIR